MRVETSSSDTSIASSPTKQLPSKKESWILLTLAALNFTHIVDFMIVMPLGPQLMRIFSITPAQHSALVSSYTFAAGLAGFFGAFAIDRFDRKKALVWVYAFFCLGTLACAIAPTYEWLLFTRAVTGAFGGLQASLVLAVVGDLIPLERRGRAMGIVMTAFSFASVVGVPLSLFLANAFSWHAPFLLVGGSGIFVFFLLQRIMPNMRGHIVAKQEARDSSQRNEIDPVKILSHLIREPNTRFALLFTFFLMFGQFTMIPFITPFMVGNVGFSEAQLPWIYFVGGGLTIFTAPLVGRMADRFGKTKIFTLFSLLVPIPILFLTHLGPSPIWFGLLATTLFFVFTNGRVVTSTTMTSAVVPPHERGTFTSINSCVQQIGAGAAAALAGWIVVKGEGQQLLHYDLVGYVTVLFTFVALYFGRKIKLLT